MPKDDPLGQSRPAPRALWLGKENMAEARDNFWRAYLAHRQQQPAVEWREFSPPAEGNLTLTHYIMSEDEARAIWEISWAAAIAAHSYVWEGRTQP